MRKIIAITQVTLDGVMQAPGGAEEDPSSGFNYGGWAMSYSDPVWEKLIGEMMAGEFDMLLGRKTYEIFAGYWPKQNDDKGIARAFDKATKYVATRTLDRLDWQNSQRIGDAVEGVKALKASDGPEVHIWGSGNLLQALIAADLIDEYRLWVFPVVLGKGRRLFESGVPPRGLILTATASNSNGVLFNTYRPAGLPPHMTR